MTTDERVIHVFMPVLDGPMPAQWLIWGKTFERVREDFEDTPRPLPGSYKFVEKVRVQISLQTPEELLERTDNQWSRITGVLVDAGGDAAAQEKIFERLLYIYDKVKHADNALYQKLGRFPVVLLLPQCATYSQAVSEFASRIADEGSLQDIPVDTHPITTSRGFIDMMRNIEWQLARDWKNRKAA